MTKEQRVALQKYEHHLKMSAEKSRRWRKAHPEYERKRNPYKKAWWRAHRGKGQYSDVNLSLQP